MIANLLARAIAMAGKTVVAAAVNVAANELKRPENQQKIAEKLEVASNALRDPQKRDAAVRTLGRAAGVLRNALKGPTDLR